MGDTVSPSRIPVCRPTYKEMSIVTERPQKPAMATYTARLKTFLNAGPSKFEVRVEDLAAAGFYCEDHNFTTRCFACGGAWTSWHASQDAMVEHARCFPECFYVVLAVGEDFIKKVKELAAKHRYISSQMVINELRREGHVTVTDDPTNVKNYPAVKAVVDLGLNIDTVADLATSLMKENKGVVCADQLMEAILSDDRFDKTLLEKILPSADVTNCEDINEVSVQNVALGQLTLCKVCLDLPVAIMFLPCGHFVTCFDCSFPLRKCPLCRTLIRGKVRGRLLRTSHLETT